MFLACLCSQEAPMRHQHHHHHHQSDGALAAASRGSSITQMKWESLGTRQDLTRTRNRQLSSGYSEKLQCECHKRRSVSSYKPVDRDTHSECDLGSATALIVVGLDSRDYIKYVKHVDDPTLCWLQRRTRRLHCDTPRECFKKANVSCPNRDWCVSVMCTHTLRRLTFRPARFYISAGTTLDAAITRAKRVSPKSPIPLNSSSSQLAPKDVNGVNCELHGTRCDGASSCNAAWSGMHRYESYRSLVCGLRNHKLYGHHRPSVS
ncbi:hypothetical protein B566_EDAN001324 [Ephemera danica]|nr:hypothetical protein B566_EDAN001324 [Ephemera danica]